MISYYIMIFLSVLVFSFSSFAQNMKSSEVRPSPLFTKGYYTIGNHAEKLQRFSLPVPDSVVYDVATKGYYSIPSVDSGRRKKAGWLQKTASRPAFEKGYYTIGAQDK